jgi:hypothetical protein
MEAKLIYESLNKLKGGKGDKLKISDVSKYQFNIGVLIEREHTSSKEKQTEIALDHLAENPKYYSDLIQRGLADEPNAIKLYIKYFGTKKLPKKYLKLIKEEKYMIL